MNFDDAIAAHMEWRTKLRTYIKKADKSLNADTVQKDDQCILGKWIYGEGSQYKTDGNYLDLLQEHAKFHKCAAEVVRQVDLGNTQEAEKMIDAKSTYTDLSLGVVSKIRKIRKTIEQ